MTLSLARAMDGFAPGLPLAVAYSGGADSTALLHLCVQRWPGQVRAIHVHHGLQVAADAFARHCEAQCTAWGVPLQVCRIDARHAPGESPEDAARRARYQAIAAALQTPSAQVAIKNVALAQHADDQAETLLLALCRGAGLAGLAAMPATWQRDGLSFYRPLLAVPGADLRHYLSEEGVGWIEDPSNADARYTRNHVRQLVLPALEAVAPHFRITLARSAAHAAQAQELISELGAADLLVSGNPPRIAALQALSTARQTNLLRHWLASTHGVAPSAAQMVELLRQIAACRTRGHRIRLRVAGGWCERRGGELHWYNQRVLHT